MVKYRKVWAEDGGRLLFLVCKDRRCVMLRVLDEHELRTQDDIEEQYPNCKYIWIIKSGRDTHGLLYAVSDDLDSSHDMYVEADRVRKEGRRCVVSGSYNEGEMAGVQFIFEQTESIQSQL